MWLVLKGLTGCTQQPFCGQDTLQNGATTCAGPLQTPLLAEGTRKNQFPWKNTHCHREEETNTQDLYFDIMGEQDLLNMADILWPDNSSLLRTGAFMHPSGLPLPHNVQIYRVIDHRSLNVMKCVWQNGAHAYGTAFWPSQTFRNLSNFKPAIWRRKGPLI